MLKVSRGAVPLPPILRANRLAGYRQAMQQHFKLPPEERHRRRAPIDSDLLMDAELHAALGKVFSGKCAYCESGLDAEAGNVTRLRPASNAGSSHDQQSSPDHYAWLAYEWRNMLLLCAHCDRMKHNLFPVTGPRALPLTTWNETVAAEDALLLDPCVDEPRRHLGFTFDGLAYPITERGLVTIDILGLNRPPLQKARAAVFQTLRFMPPKPAMQELAELFDAARPHAGALRIFAIGLCRVAAGLDTIRLPASLKDLLFLLADARNKLTDTEWPDAMTLVGNTYRFKRLQPQQPVAAAVPSPRQPRRDQPRLQSIHIRHFKGIDNIVLDLTGRQRGRSSQAPCAMLLGENAVGKSSILQAVAMALMSAQQLRELKLEPEDFFSRDPGGWQLTDAGPPEATLRFQDGLQIRLRYDELGTNLDDPHNDSPCHVLAYGSRRYFVEEGRKRRGSVLNKSLFDPQATLPDPSLWLRSVPSYTFDAVARAMREVLSLREDDRIMRTEDGHVLVSAHGRLSPVERMSDGYRSLFAMAIDIMRNMLEIWDNLEYARGIVLIDEIETHLHPRWKMQVMSALRRAMPQVQFIATTHDPLCLRGMKNGEVHVLYRDEQGGIRLLADLPDIETMRAEQILTSDYFGLWTTADPQQETVLMRLAQLGGRADSELSEVEKNTRDALLRQFDGLPVIGDSPDRQILTEAMTRHLRNQQSTPADQRAALREDAIDQIVGVLERAMRP